MYNNNSFNTVKKKRRLEYEENKMKRLGNEEPKRVRYRKLMND